MVQSYSPGGGNVSSHEGTLVPPAEYNLCILWPTLVHNPNGKSIGSAVFAQLTAESAYTLHWRHLSYPPELPLPMGSGHHLTHDSLGPCEPKTQTASRSVQPFLHRWPQSVPILYNGSPISPSKLPLPMENGSGPHAMHGFLGLPESSTQTATRSLQSFLQGSL